MIYGGKIKIVIINFSPSSLLAVTMVPAASLEGRVLPGADAQEQFMKSSRSSRAIPQESVKVHRRRSSAQTGL